MEVVDTPLAGVRVLELASVLAGPLAGSALAERGAQVTKVERPPEGDVTRTWRSPGEQTGPESAYWMAANAGKEVVFQDLNSPEGRDWLEAELDRSDVLLENFKTADLQRFGLDPERVRRRWPRLVRVRLVGFPNAPERLAYDVVVQAETGFMAMNGAADGPPTRMPVALMDVLASHHIRTAALEGLLYRASTGRGCFTVVSLEASGLSALANTATEWLVNGHVPTRRGSEHPNIAPYGDLLPCRDGWIVLAVGSDRQFAGLCSVLGWTEGPTELRFATNPERVVHRRELLAALSARAAHREVAELADALLQAGVPAGRVRSLDEVFAPGATGAALVRTDAFGRRVSPVAYSMES